MMLLLSVKVSATPSLSSTHCTLPYHCTSILFIVFYLFNLRYYMLTPVFNELTLQSFLHFHLIFCLRD